MTQAMALISASVLVQMRALEWDYLLMRRSQAVEQPEATWRRPLRRHIITVEHCGVRITADLRVMMAIEHGCHSWAGFKISYCSGNRPGVSGGIPLANVPKGSTPVH